MPLIRFIYPPAIREHGDKPVHVEEMQARHLVEGIRQAVRVTEDDLAGLKKNDLVELAEQVPGVDLPKRGAKGQFVKAISEAQESE